MNVIEEYKQKTSFIKSFPAIKYYLEKGLNEEKSGLFIKKSKFAELIESFKDDLKTQLTNDEVDKLKKLEIKSTENSLILLLPYLNYPLIGYNLGKIPFLFKSAGWLFHATTYEGLKSCSRSGVLISPIEMILDKKTFFSHRFLQHPNLKRLHGLPFAFQDAVLYQGYTVRTEKSRIVSFGGFFIFPFEYVINEGLILKFLVMPEIDLMDTTQIKLSGIFNILIDLKRDYDYLLGKLDDAGKFLKICKENLDRLRWIVNIQQNRILQKNPLLHPFEGLWNKNKLFKEIERFAASEYWMANFLRNIEENDFFSFVLNINNFSSNTEYITPKYKIYAQKEMPSYLNGTIFHGGLYYYLIPSNMSSLQGQFLIAQFQKETNNLSPDAINGVKRLDYKGVNRLIKTTKYNVIKSIETLVPLSRTKSPNRVDIRNGILFLTKNWYHLYKEDDILQRIVSFGIPVVVGFESNEHNLIDKQEINQFIYNFLRVKDLPVLESYRRSEGYFHCRNVIEGKEIYYNDGTNEIRII